MEKPKKDSVSAKCDSEVWEKFKKMAAADHRSAASMIEKLICEAVARYEQSAG
jgi:hypothetical protein